VRIGGLVDVRITDRSCSHVEGRHRESGWDGLLVDWRIGGFFL